MYFYGHFTTMYGVRATCRNMVTVKDEVTISNKRLTNVAGNLLVIYATWTSVVRYLRYLD